MTSLISYEINDGQLIISVLFNLWFESLFSRIIHNTYLKGPIKTAIIMHRENIYLAPAILFGWNQTGDTKDCRYITRSNQTLKKLACNKGLYVIMYMDQRVSLLG